MSFTELHQSILSENELMTRFLSSLDKEHALLLDSYSNDALFDVTELKNHYIDLLNKVADRRDKALFDLELPAGRDGLLAAQAKHAALREPIEGLLDTVEKAKIRNDENGLLIHSYLEYSVEALNALNQANPLANKTHVYDAKGKTRTATSAHRGIVRA